MTNRNQRTIEHLRRRLKGRIYIRCGNIDTHRKFLQDAENEGYLVGGKRPTEADMPWDIIALETDRKLRYCGFTDHMAFHLNGDAYRVDYGRYVSGELDYLWQDNRHAVRLFSSDHFGECQISGRRTEEALTYYRMQIRYFDTERSEKMLFAEMEHFFRVLVAAENGETK